MCTQKPPNNWSEHLYNNYCDAVKDYLSARILPRIKEKHNEAMLKELVRRWENHKLMIKFLSHVFKYLDRFYVKRLSLPELAEVCACARHHTLCAGRVRTCSACAVAGQLVRAAALTPTRTLCASQVGSQSFHDIVFNAVKRDVRSAILEVCTTPHPQLPSSGRGSGHGRGARRAAAWRAGTTWSARDEPCARAAASCGRPREAARACMHAWDVAVARASSLCARRPRC